MSAELWNEETPQPRTPSNSNHNFIQNETAWIFTVFMLTNSGNQVGGYANIECGVGFVCHHIHRTSPDHMTILAQGTNIKGDSSLRSE